MSDISTRSSEYKALAALHPAAVVGYLRGKGWGKSRDYGQNGAVFVAGVNGKETEVIVPIERQARDFAAVMTVLVSDIARFEDRSSFDVLADLSMAGFDVIRVRSPEADDIGSVQLTAGVELHEHARDIILFAANVVASGTTRANWRGRRFELVDNYISSLRLGQTQRGSFVISLLSRWEFDVEQEGAQVSFGLFDEPFGRRATRALGRALEATATALRLSALEGPIAAFAPAVRLGVSANLCQSLAEIAQCGDGADISIRWSYTKPEAGEPILRLRRGDGQMLREAAQRLAESEPVTDMVLQGVVTQIKEEPKSFDGITTIEALVDGSLRRVKVLFDASDTMQRDTLIEAFKERKRLSVTGQMIKEGTRLRLENPHDLTILTSPDGDDP